MVMMSRYLPIAGILFMCQWILCIGSDFDNEFNHYSGNPIEQLKICGERCSGTNYVRFLLHANFPHVVAAPWIESGHKHWLWWFGRPLDEEKLQKLRYSPKAVTLSDSENCLFVIVVRSPYDWVRSFYQIPHSVHPDLLGKGFFHFLSSEWKASRFEGLYEEIDNCNPWTGQPFPNVLRLRKYKIQNYLFASTLVDNYLFVRYEDVRDNPEAFISFVADYYNLKKSERFCTIDNHLGTGRPFVEPKYTVIHPEELEFINDQLDWLLEGAVGYFKEDRS